MQKRQKKVRTSSFSTHGIPRTPFTHAELIWGLSLCKYSTNYSRASETIYSYHRLWEPSVANGVICIVNGNALLVCSIWFCTGATWGAMWGLWVGLSTARIHSTRPRLPLVDQKLSQEPRLEEELSIFFLCFSPGNRIKEFHCDRKTLKQTACATAAEMFEIFTS